MNPYLKCIISFILGLLCIYLGYSMMPTDRMAIVYFLYFVGLVNIYIGVKDLAAILKSKK
jgi:xanthosine utilization system XapX-like protein